MTLKNKTALVTGASRGIGRATAAALPRAGAHVLVHYGRSAQQAESLVSETQAKGSRANAISADLGVPNGAALLAKRVRSIVGDQLDVLVLNAGISKAARIADYTVENFNNSLCDQRSRAILPSAANAANSRGGFKYHCDLLRSRPYGGGQAGLENPSILAYGATKGAIETLVKNWAAILGPRGIRVNAVAPGVIDTDMSNFTKTETGRELTLGMQALKRIGNGKTWLMSLRSWRRTRRAGSLAPVFPLMARSCS